MRRNQPRFGPVAGLRRGLTPPGPEHHPAGSKPYSRSRSMGPAFSTFLTAASPAGSMTTDNEALNVPLASRQRPRFEVAKGRVPQCSWIAADPKAFAGSHDRVVAKAAQSAGLRVPPDQIHPRASTCGSRRRLSGARKFLPGRATVAEARALSCMRLARDAQCCKRAQSIRATARKLITKESRPRQSEKLAAGSTCSRA